MPERKGRTKEQSLWLVLVWVVTLAAMVGLGVLLGKYVLSYCASSLQAPRSSQTQTTGSSSQAKTNSQSSAISVPPSSPEVPGEESRIPSKEPAAATPDKTEITSGSDGVVDESVLYKVQVGEFYDRSEAEELRHELEDAGYPVFVTTVTPHRIQVGAFKNKANADALASELEAQGYSVIIMR